MISILLRKITSFETKRYTVLFKKPLEVRVYEDYIKVEPIGFSIKLGKVGIDKYLSRKFNFIVWFYYRSFTYKIMRGIFNKKNPYNKIIKNIYESNGGTTWKRIY